MADDSQQPRSDAQSDSADECDEPVAGTAFSDYVALSTADDAARRQPRDTTQAADAWRRVDATAAPALDDALRRPRVIKPPPPPESEEIPRPRPTSVRFVPQRPPCKSLRELALDSAQIKFRGASRIMTCTPSTRRLLDAATARWRDETPSPRGKHVCASSNIFC